MPLSIPSPATPRLTTAINDQIRSQANDVNSQRDHRQICGVLGKSLTVIIPYPLETLAGNSNLAMQSQRHVFPDSIL